MSDFILTWNMDQFGGNPSASTELHITSNVALVDDTDRVIFDRSRRVAVRQLGARLPAADVRPHEFGFLIEDKASGRSWTLPTQPAETVIDLSTLTSTTPLPVPPGYDQQLAYLDERIDVLEEQGPGGGGSATWPVAGTPSTFPPSAHTHPLGEVAGLAAVFAEKIDKPNGGADGQVLVKAGAGASWVSVTGGTSTGIPAIAALEMQPAVVLGHSWSAVDTNATPGTRWYERLVSRLRMTTATNKAVSGRTIGDIANLALSGSNSWVIRTRALAAIICTINDVTIFNASAASRRGYAHAWRAILARITANAAVASNTISFAYSPGWTSEAVTGTSGSTQGGTANSTGGTRYKTTTVGASCDLTYTDSGTGVDVVLVARTAGAGLVTFTEGGTTLGTLDLTATTGQDCPAIFRVRGLAAGAHTIRATLTSGASLTVDSYLIPSSFPVPVLVGGEPTVVPKPADQATYVADVETFKGDLAGIVAEYPTAVYVDLNSTEWDTATMLVNDADGGKKHPNDKGCGYIAGRCIAALASYQPVQGLNVTVSSTRAPGAYTAPPAPGIPAGGQDGTGTPGGSSDTTAPTVPGTPTASAGVTQATATTSGSTDAVGVTGYRWFRSGTLVGTTAGTSFIETGLPAGTPVAYTAAAIDAAGNASAQSAVSNSVTPTAGSDTTAPTVPGTPVATAGTGQNSVTTPGSTDAVGVTGYRWYRSDIGAASALTDTAGTTLTDTTAPVGTPVTYTAKAFDAAGNTSAASAASNSVTATAPPAGTLPTGFASRYRASDDPVAVGSEVTSWADTGTAGIPFTATAGNAPTKRDTGTFKYLEFDGAGDFMQRANPARPKTRFFVARYRQTTAGTQILAGTNASSAEIVGRSSTGTHILNNGSVVGSRTADNGWHVITAVWDAAGTASIIAVDAQTDQTGSVGGNTPGATQYLARQSTATTYQVDIAEVVSYTSVISASDRDQAVAYLKAQYGITT